MTDNNSIFNMESCSGSHASETSRSHCSKRRSKPFKLPPCYSLDLAVEEMERKSSEQSKLAAAVLQAFRGDMTELKKAERTTEQELKSKGVNPGDPDLDVSQVFSINRRRKGRENASGSQTDSENAAAKKDGSQIKESNETLSKSDELDYYSNRVHILEENNAQAADAEILPWLQEDHSSANYVSTEQLNRLFEPMNEVYSGLEVELEIPIYIPPAIAQVFL